MRGSLCHRIGFELYQSRRNRGVWNVCMVLGEWVDDLGQGLGWWSGVMYLCVVSLDFLCKWQVQVSVYCARRLPAHFRCTQCSILLHLIDIYFQPCICLWQISQIQTCCVWLSDLD